MTKKKKKKKKNRKNVELIKKIMTEKKTTLPSLRKQEWKKVKVQTKKIKMSTHITEPNKLIYA